MHISSNEILSKKQLTIGGVTHKLIYKLKLFSFINVRQTLLLHFNTPLACGLLAKPNTCTQF